MNITHRKMALKQRTLLLLLMLLCLAGSACENGDEEAESASADERPNIIFIFTDAPPQAEQHQENA